MKPSRKPRPQAVDAHIQAIAGQIAAGKFVVMTDEQLAISIRGALHTIPHQPPGAGGFADLLYILAAQLAARPAIQTALAQATPAGMVN
jgi:hypothetical protein